MLQFESGFDFFYFSIIPRNVQNPLCSGPAAI